MCTWYSSFHRWGYVLQVDLVCLLCQCMVDAARWGDGLKACESAMSVLPSATHLPLSKWKVSIYHVVDVAFVTPAGCTLVVPCSQSDPHHVAVSARKSDTEECNTVMYSVAQHSTTQTSVHSAAQCTSTQHSTAQHGTNCRT